MGGDREPDAERCRHGDVAALEAPRGRVNRRVTLVVLWWNRWELTERGVERVRTWSDLAAADVVVDNGATRETDVDQYAAAREVEGIVFACAYIRREVLDAIGALSEEYVSYFEDTDYCLRAKDAGFRTLVCGAVTIVHHEHGSTSDTPEVF